MNRDESLTAAKKYLVDLLSFFEVNADVEANIEDDIIELSVADTEINSLLIGRNSENLRSLQFVISAMLRSQDAELSRVNLDIAGYKKQRAEKVAAQAREWMEEVRSTGDSRIVRMNAADRRVVHQVAQEFSDLRTYSEGEGRDRKLYIVQQSS